MNDYNTPQQYHDIMRKAVRAYDQLGKEPKEVLAPIWLGLVAGLELAQMYVAQTQDLDKASA